MRPTEPLRISSVAELQRWADAERAAGRTIGLVPTMGALHAGHLSLVRIAHAHTQRVVVSVFVNPTQFGPGEDFDSYPRDLEQDVALLRAEKVDVVFCPTVEEMYPAGDVTSVAVSRLTEGLCGRDRPGHFAGVTTIVARLLLAAKPHVAVFGEKDFQQLAVLQRMVRDLHFDVEVVGGPIVREPDGVAMSSRNAYLSPAARQQATALNAGLAAARELVRASVVDAASLVACVRARIEKEPLAEIDYVELRDAESLDPVDRVDRRAVLAVAVRFESARLLDNTLLRPS